jgi:hypothetical protein
MKAVFDRTTNPTAIINALRAITGLTELDVHRAHFLWDKLLETFSPRLLTIMAVEEALRNRNVLDLSHVLDRTGLSCDRSRCLDAIKFKNEELLSDPW